MINSNRAEVPKHSNPPYEAINSDWRANHGRPQIQLALALYRLAVYLRHNNFTRIFAPLASVIYRGYALAVIGLDIPVSTRIGPRLRIHHGMALVINAGTVIGADVTLRHSTTLGSKVGGAAPRLCDEVDIGPNSVIIGNVQIGRAAVVGAGSVVTKDVLDGATVAGNPARALNLLGPGQESEVG